MIWKTRLNLEALNHPANSFVTLTYRDEKLPKLPNGLFTLMPRDLSLWLKRLRKAIQPSQIRFYAAGEYGDRLQRPHYHAILFGYPGCYYGRSRYNDGRTIDCCSSCDTIRDTWNLGIIECQPMAAEHAAYTAGYVMKKLTSKHDARLNGRHPEFSRMSLKNGGLGSHVVPQLAKISHQRIVAGQAIDVCESVRMDGKKALLGRYIRAKIRKELGGDGKAPPEVIAQMEQKMLPLLARARADPEVNTLRKQIIKEAQGSINSLKNRYENQNSRKRNRTL